MIERSPELYLYRKRYIPEENVLLKDDIVLLRTDSLIITCWRALHPRNDICRGISAYLLDKNIKVSKVYNHIDELVHWYCDIIEVEHAEGSNVYTFLDLLIDVLVYEDGTSKVMDLDEAGDLLASGKLAVHKAALALKTANHLLTDIYAGNFFKYKNIINEAEKNTSITPAY